MKRLILVRHAKTESIQYKKTDHERNLTNRGINDANNIANFLNEQKIIPDLILTSTANRAIQTTNILASTFSYETNKLQTIANLYEHYTSSDFIDMIIKESKDNNTIMIIGHNPCLENMAYSLLNNFNYSVPTSCVICIDFDIENWDSLEVRTGKLSLYKTAKTL